MNKQKDTSKASYRFSLFPLLSRAGWVSAILFNIIVIVVFIDGVYPYLVGWDLSERWQAVGEWTGSLERGELRIGESGLFESRAEGVQPDRLGVRLAVSERTKFDLVIADQGQSRVVFRLSGSGLYLPGVYREEPGKTSSLGTIKFSPVPRVFHRVEIVREEETYTLFVNGQPASSDIRLVDAAGRFGFGGVRGGVRVNEVWLDGTDPDTGEKIRLREKFGWRASVFAWRLFLTLVFVNGFILVLVVILKGHRYRSKRLSDKLELHALSEADITWPHFIVPSILVIATTVFAAILAPGDGSFFHSPLAALAIPLVWCVYSLTIAFAHRLPWRFLLVADSFTYIPLLFWAVWCCLALEDRLQASEFFLNHLWKVVPLVFGFKLYLVAGYLHRARARVAAVLFTVLFGIFLSEASTWLVPEQQFQKQVSTSRELDNRCRARFSLRELSPATQIGPAGSAFPGAEELRVWIVGRDPMNSDVEESDTFTALVQDALGKEFPDRSIAMRVNFFVLPDGSSVTSLDVLELLRSQMETPGPHIVVTLFGSGDGRPSPVYPRTLTQYRSLILEQDEDSLFEGMRLILAGRNFLLKFRSGATRLSKRLPHVPHVSVDEFRENVSAIFHLGQENGFSVVLVKPPFLNEYLSFETHHGESGIPYYRILDQMGETGQALVVDGNLAFYRKRGVSLFKDRFTVNEEGGQVLAEEIAQTVARAANESILEIESP